MHSMALQFYSKEYTQQKCMHILLINKRLQEYSQQHYFESTKLETTQMPTSIKIDM